jgi:hypothetical protein
MELYSLLVLCHALSDLVQTADAVSLLLRSAHLPTVSIPASGLVPSSSSSVATSALPSPVLFPAAPDVDALSLCLGFCSFADRDVAHLAIMLLKSIVRHPRVSTAFMDRRGPDIIVPLALNPQSHEASVNSWTYFTGPFCALMLRFGSENDDDRVLLVVV